MRKIKIVDRFVPNCPIRNILSRISDEWSILTLYTLQKNKVMRFKELQRSLPDISQKMLTVTLRILEEDGLVERTVFAEVPPKVEYQLTNRALILFPHIDKLIEWAHDNMNDIIKERTTKN